MSTDERFTVLEKWVSKHPGISHPVITPASSDASFRRYFRVQADEGTWIVMDAPPEKENCEPFLYVGKHLHAFGLNVPVIHEADLERGFLLLGDLGSDPYLSALNSESADQLYRDAIDALVRMQKQGRESGDTLPPYDHELLMTEMHLFTDWYVDRHCNVKLSAGRRAQFADWFEQLAAMALAQPEVWVHRDYHSRNLMVVPGNNPGILDFQDAVLGPITYDLVSLLRDCYIRWPADRVKDWVHYYCDRAITAGLLDETRFDSQQFMRWFDWMGVQRHLKATGIFARLLHRDDKSGYIKDIPRTLGYVIDVCKDYAELAELASWIEQNLPKDVHDV